MSEFARKCPTPEEIQKYFHMELEEDELKQIEIHFSRCSKCASEYDYYGNFIKQTVLSARVQKELWLNANVDTFSVVAASSYDNTGISEIKSRDGKYILKKIPYMDDAATSLLVIRLTVPIKQGKLSVYYLEDSIPVLIGSEPINEDNNVCFEVTSDIQLKNLMITLA